MNFYQRIRQEASDKAQQHIECNFKPVLDKAFKELCDWLPRRRIKVVFGMGTFVLDIENKSKYS